MFTFVLICHKTFCAPRTLRPRAPAPGGGGTCPPLCHRWLRHWSIYVKLGRFSPVVRKNIFFSGRITSLWSATYVRWQRGTARIRPPLLQRSIDISCPPGPQQQTCCGPMLGQTDTVPFYRSCSAHSAGGSAIKWKGTNLPVVRLVAIQYQILKSKLTTIWKGPGLYTSVLQRFLPHHQLYWVLARICGVKSRT